VPIQTAASKRQTAKEPDVSPIKSLTTALVVAGAAAAPGASARLQLNPPSSHQPPPPIRVVQAPADNGFDWGDAGIGAGGVIALTLLSLGGVTAARRGSHGIRRTVSPAR
jgi:hypothetical protein